MTVGLAAVAAVAIGLWLARDQPRRLLEAALAERFDAEVSVGSLRFEGVSAVRLRQVRIRMHAAPGLREVRIAEIGAAGAVGEMARGRFQSLQLIGVEVVVDPAAGDVWPAVLGGATLPEVTRFGIAGGRLTVLSPDGDSLVGFTAELDDLGLMPSGTVHFTSRRLELDPLLRLAGVDVSDRVGRAWAEDLVGELRVAADRPRLGLSVRVERFSAAGWPDPAVARLEGTVAELAPGVFQVVVVPSLPSVGEARVEATLATSPWRVTWLRLLVKGLDAGAWLSPLELLPRRWSVVGGTLDLEVSGEPAGALAVDVAAHDLDLAAPFSVRGNLQGQGEVRIDDTAALTGRLELTGGVARAPAESAPSAMLDAVLPVTLAASLDLAAAHRPLAGSLQLNTASAGDLGVTGTVGLTAAGPLDANWSWSGGDLGRLMDAFAPDTAAAFPGGLAVTGTVAAHGRLGGNLTAPTLAAEMQVRDLVARPDNAVAAGAPAWRLHGEHPVARWVWTSAAPTIEVDVPETPLTVAVDPLGQVPVTLQAAVALDLAGGGARIRHVVVDAGALGTARLEASWLSPTAPSARLAVQVADLSGWLPFAARVLGASLRDTSATGKATLELEATRDTTGWSFDGPLEVAAAGLSAAGGSRVMEGLQASALLRGAVGPDGSLSANLAARLGGFQVLWGTHYADFADRQVVVNIDVNRGWDGDATAAVRLELPPHAALTGTLRVTAAAPPAWEGSLTIADLGGFWLHWVEVPSEGTLGRVGGLRVAGGVLRARLRGTVAAGVTVAGELGLEGLSIASADDRLDLEQLSVRLPVDLGWTADGGVKAGEAHRGSMGFARAAIGEGQLAATEIELAVLGDSVTVVGSLHLPVFGGEVVLENAGFAEVTRPGRHLTASVGLHHISLAGLSRALGLPPLEGDLAGRFPRVLYSNGILTVDGTGELAVFGGTVTTREITGSDLFTRYPRLTFSADWQEVDLAQVTRTFDFGTMSGIVEGRLVDCEIFRDVPVRFRGHLRSVPRKGVPQRISLKAVNNIAIVGTGSGLGFLDRGLRRFIDSYAYRAIGIEMALSEDHFLLRGLERRGDRELFVKGRFPLRLDVVNVDPGMTVSFQTMIKRLGTLDVTTVTPQPKRGLPERRTRG